MIPLADINEALAGHNVSAYRTMRGISRDTDAIVALPDHRDRLLEWAERQIEQLRQPYEAERQRWQGQHDAALEEISDILTDAGIDPSPVPASDRRADLTRRYQQLLDKLEQRQREREILGPDREQRHRNRFQQQGLVVWPEPPDRYVQAGRKIRELFATADLAAAHVERLTARIQDSTPEAADDHHQWIWSMMPPGTTRKPDHPDTRPALDPEVHQTLVEIGILDGETAPPRRTRPNRPRR